MRPGLPHRRVNKRTGMDWGLKSWRRRRTLRHSALPEEAWHDAVCGRALFGGLSAPELDRLRQLTTLFLNEKQMVAAGGFVLDVEACIKIAAQACLPVLNLGLDYYAGWVSVIVYPDEFVPEHEYMDEYGVVHSVREPVMGESWDRGPVVLSGADALRCGAPDGINVVIHELAHKLDGLNGSLNGLPPLHQGMSQQDWAQAFTAAYRDFCAKLDSGQYTALDPYASESPAEFFAVSSEAFFVAPGALEHEYPEVYRQLCAFYRQQPAQRQALENTVLAESAF